MKHSMKAPSVVFVLSLRRFFLLMYTSNAAVLSGAKSFKPWAFWRTSVFDMKWAFSPEKDLLGTQSVDLLISTAQAKIIIISRR